MKLIFTSYAGVPEFDEPGLWLQRIEGYTGILESLTAMHEVTGIERINYEGEYAHKGVRYIFTRQNKKTVLFPRRIHGHIKQLRPDVVFINGFIFPLQLIQLRLQLGRKIKIIVINRSEKPGKGYRKLLQQMADRCVDAYLFTSHRFGYQWTDKGNIKDRKKIHEVFHGSSVFTPGDKQQAQKELGVSGSPVYLWVGRLNENKDPLTVIHAFSKFLQEHPSAILYMIYHETELLEAVRKAITENNMAGRVRLIGKVPHQALQAWFRAADFFISASHYEGGGIAVCEAMSCGCVPVVTAIDSFRLLTGEGEIGLLFQPGDEHSLLHALRQSLTLDIASASTKVLEQFNTHFSFNAIARKADVVIQSLFSANP